MEHKTARKPRRRVIVALLLAASFFLPTAFVDSAWAAPDVSVSLTQQTGSAPWNDQSFVPGTLENAGMDASPNDNVVRTNDTVTYQVGVSTTETINNTMIRIQIPQGEEIKAPPAFCGAGSSVTPALSAPNIASLTLPEAQTLVCNVGTVASGAAAGFSFTTKVRPEVPNDTTLSTQASVTANDSTTVLGTSETVSHVVTQAPKWDISINSTIPQENQSFIKQGTIQRCATGLGIPPNSDGSNQWCWVGGYQVVLSAPDAGKGASPMLNGDFTATFPMDAESVWGKDAVAAAAAQGITLSGAYLGSNLAANYEGPYDRLTAKGATTQNAVRNSGTITFSQPNPKTPQAAGQPVTLTVKGADTTAYTVPTDMASPAGGKLQADRGYVFVQRVFFYVPLNNVVAGSDALDNLANFDTDPTAKVLRPNFTFTTSEENLKYDTVPSLWNGTENVNTFDQSQAEPDNNYRTARGTIENNMRVETLWLGVPKDTSSTKKDVFNPGFPAMWGPSGQTGYSTGDGVAVEGQTVLQSIHLQGNTMQGVTSLVCSAFDNSVVNVDPEAVVPGDGTMQGIGSDATGKYDLNPYRDTDTGGATWISGNQRNFNGTDLTKAVATDTGQYTLPNRVGEFRVQYGVGDVNDTTCAKNITWYDNLSDVDISQVNKVRYFLQSKPGYNAVYARDNITTAMKVLPGQDPGTTSPTYVNWTQKAGATNTFEDMLGVPAADWTRSDYDQKADLAGILNDTDTDYTNISGDVFTIVDVVANITKQSETKSGSGEYVTTDEWVPTRSGTDGEWNSVNTTPKYGPGQSFHFRITPELYSTPEPAPGTLRTVLIEDCLPVGIVPDSAATASNSLWNYQGSEATPYKRQLECGVGEFYLAWYMPNIDISKGLIMPGRDQPIEHLDVGVKVPETAMTGKRTNKTQISVASKSNQLDFVSAVPSNIDQRTGLASAQIEAPDGVQIAKSTQTPIVFVDENGWTSSEFVTWQIRARNLSNATNIENVDVIDFLPRNGVDGSDFTGSGDFVNVEVVDNPTGVVGNDNLRILYTKAVPTDATINNMRDPLDPSNQADGSTVWCDSFAGEGCPASASEVTGVRIQRAGEFPNKAEFTVLIHTKAAGNIGDAEGVPGDVMHNATVMRVGGIDVPVTSDETVKFSSRDVPPNTARITGQIWDDLNSDGIWQKCDPATPSEPCEPPLTQVIVMLTDANGEPVLNAAGQPIWGVTNADGTYLLLEVPGPKDPEVPAEYYVRVVTDSSQSPTDGGNLLSGYSPTLSGIDSLISPHKVLVGKESQYTSGIDFGYRKPGDVAVSKSAKVLHEGAETQPPAVVGDRVEYTVTIKNTSKQRNFTELYPARVVDDLRKVLDDAVMAEAPKASAGTLTQQNGQWVWYGPLATDDGAAGGADEVTITYSVTVTGAGNALLDNVAFDSPIPLDYDPNNPGSGLPIDPETGEPVLVDDPKNPPTLDPTPGDAITPPETCEAPSCASTSTPVAGPEEPVISKTVDKKTVKAGDAFTYEVTIRNNGKVDYSAEQPASFIDDVSAVLDDGEIITGPTASAGSAKLVGSRIVWSGPLASGESVTVKYTVKAHADGDRSARNIAFQTAAYPIDPATGVPTDPETGGPVPTPANCAAPFCASTVTEVVVSQPVPIDPKKLANTGGAAVSPLLWLTLLGLGALALAAGRRRREQ